MNTSRTNWRIAASIPELKSNQVHVWRVILDQVAAHAPTIASVLSDDEKARASRIRVSKGREEYVAARALLRTLLSRYLDLAPSQLQFTYSAEGKPALATESNLGGLQFNLSHSHGIALYAITRGREIGIDVERVSDDFDYREIARRFFSQMKMSEVEALSPNAFFRQWTRSEAIAKAEGKGLDQFNRAAEEKTDWTVVELDPAPGFVAAVAAKGDDWTMEYFDWEMSNSHT